MDIFILGAIAIANIIAIALLWFCLKGLNQKEKFLWIAVGVAIMYLIVNGICLFSGSDKFANEEAAQMSRNLLTFTFVPVNVILIEAYIARSYRQYREGDIEKYRFKRRCFVFAILFCILVAVEFNYIASIQETTGNYIEHSTSATTH